MKRKVKIFLALAVLAAFLVFLAVRFSHPRRIGSDFSKISVGGKTFEVEMAESEEARRRGLGQRKSLCRDCGMLFIFPDRQRTSFWMKDMYFDLDIIWIAGDEIVHIEKEVSRDSIKIFNPAVLADRILEINAGLSSELGIKAGDKVLPK